MCFKNAHGTKLAFVVHQLLDDRRSLKHLNRLGSYRVDYNRRRIQSILRWNTIRSFLYGLTETTFTVFRIFQIQLQVWCMCQTLNDTVSEACVAHVVKSRGPIGTKVWCWFNIKSMASLSHYSPLIWNRLSTQPTHSIYCSNVKLIVRRRRLVKLRIKSATHC